MELDIPKLELPENPTNSDLAKAIAISLEAIGGVHGCLENHVKLTRDTEVVLSGQIKGINDQLNPNLKDSAVSKLNARLDPVANWFITFQKRRAYIVGALGSIVVSVAGGVALNTYNALTTQHIAVKQEENAKTVVETAANLAASQNSEPAYGYTQAKANWDMQREINAKILAKLDAIDKRKHNK